MTNQQINSIKTIFQRRLTTLEHLLKVAQTHFNDDESFLQARIAPDMLPLGTQIAFTCNQPRNFALWCDGKPMDNLNPEVTSLTQAYDHIKNTQFLLDSINVEDEKLNGVTCHKIAPGFSLELSGIDYVNEFLMPNFYFHLVTAYDILRMSGVSIGKKDYMMHLMPFLKQE
jgi:uncharacterized protein